MKLPEIKSSNKGRALLAGYLIFTTLYVTAQLCLFADPVRPPTLELDTRIPFIPGSIWIYCTHYLLVVLSLLMSQDEQRLDRVYYSMLLSAVLAFIIFSVYPTEVELQAAPTSGVSAFLWQSLRSVDKPTNCLPSLHCCLAALAALSLSTRGLSWRLGAILWAGLIVISTLTTKQHVFVDAVAGLSLAVFAYWAVGYMRQREAGREASGHECK
jgi:hypothetical protein